MSFQIFNDGEIATLRKSGAILRGAIDLLAGAVKEGITTGELDRLAEEYILDHGAKPAFKGYQGYPATFCISVNEECVHGIPGKRVIKNGDIVKLDGGVKLDGLNTDACITVGVGEIDSDSKRLLSVTKEALDAAVALTKPGTRIGDISSLVQQVVENGKCTVVRSLTGHGLGYELHQFPDIPNFGRKGTGPVLLEHTLIAIEPIVSLADDDVVLGDDGWTLTTKTGSRSAHYEHTLLLVRGGCEIIA